MLSLFLSSALFQWGIFLEGQDDAYPLELVAPVERQFFLDTSSKSPDGLLSWTGNEPISDPIMATTL